MANMPSSGSISFLQLRDVFGTNAHPSVWLSWYYRGAGLVPDHQLNFGVPTAGAIALGQFYNATSTQGVFANVSKTNIDLYRSNAGNQSDSVACTATGGNGTYSWAYTWVAGGTGISLTAITGGFTVSATASLGQQRFGTVRATVTSGPFTSYKDVGVFMQWGDPV